MNVIPLTALEAASCGFTTKIVLTYADIIKLTSGAAASIFPGFNEANTFPANALVDNALVIVKTAFTGQAGTLTCAITDTPANGVTATGLDLTTTGAKGGYNLTKPTVYTAVGQLLITVTSQNAIAAWTAGEVHVYVNFIDLNTLDR
jgi:hypothetical protein